MTNKPIRLIAALAAVLLAACAAPAPSATQVAQTTRPQGEAMAAAASPYAVDAALEILRAGGSATDAAIAAEMVLGLVEPESSGIGGGGFLLHYDGRTHSIVAYDDGRERAPAGATPTMFLDAHGQPLSFLEAHTGGVAIGTPLEVAMLKMAHEDSGHLPWPHLFEPAIRLAEQGFEVSPKLAIAIAYSGDHERLRADFRTRSYFFDRQGRPLAAGALLRNPDYAATLRAIAEQGPTALTTGALADAIVEATQRQPKAGTLSLADLRGATPRRLQPVCGAYRAYRVCTMPPPSSANTTIEILGLYQRARPHPQGANNADDWAAFLWASELAYADRDHYMADDRFVPTPTQEMVAPAYLDQRARLIDLSRAPGDVEPGAPGGEELRNLWGAAWSDDPGTSHLSIVDRWGNAVALTSTVESLFGAQRMVGGFVLNNQLTDFSFLPTINGRPVANAVAPGKAPRSSMSPLIATDRNGRLVLVNGSPGSSAIIGYVARTTIGILDWGLTPQQAIDLGNATGRGQPVRAEVQRMPTGIVDSLRGRGWRIEATGPLEGSGLHIIQVTPNGLVGGADSRRPGTVGRIEGTAAPAR